MTLIHTTEYMTVSVSQERIEIERDDNMMFLNMDTASQDLEIVLTLDEAEELRDMLTRALEGAEDVKVVES